MDKHSLQFTSLITSTQSVLYAYIMSMVGDVDLANEVLQNTNVVLWDKADQFEAGTRFRSWALSVAHHEVLTARKRLARDRHVFNPELLEALSRDSAAIAQETEPRQRALKHCLDALPGPQREVVMRHYLRDEKIAEIAAEMGRRDATVRQMLHRIRVALMNCIEQRLAVSDQE